jgi:hypothetical protein
LAGRVDNAAYLIEAPYGQRKAAASAGDHLLLPGSLFALNLNCRHQKEIPMKLFAFGLSAALCISSIASADCGDDSKKVIEQKGFTVRDTFLEELYYPELTNGVNYRAWMRVAQCNKGYVIVNMYGTCLIKHVWAQGGCNVPEVQQALRGRD